MEQLLLPLVFWDFGLIRQHHLKVSCIMSTLNSLSFGTLCNDLAPFTPNWSFLMNAMLLPTHPGLVYFKIGILLRLFLTFLQSLIKWAFLDITSKWRLQGFVANPSSQKGQRKCAFEPTLVNLMGCIKSLMPIPDVALEDL